MCNLASINLSAMVVPAPAAPSAAAPNGLGVANGTEPAGRATYDFEKLRHIAGVVTRNLNRVIDVNYYPIPEARNSNMRHRPIGIGVQVRHWFERIAQNFSLSTP